MNEKKGILGWIVAGIFGITGFLILLGKILMKKQNAESAQVEDGKVKCNVILGYIAKYVNDDAFEEADIKCRLGGIEVYFDHATLKDGKGTVTIDSMFSGIDLYVPKDWVVENNVNVTFGALENVNKQTVKSDPNKVLTLEGNLCFGAIEVTFI